MGRGSCEKRVSAMKKILFILLAVGLPVGVATLANPGDLRISGWPAMTLLALGCLGIQWLAFVPARLLQTERFYDLTGSLTYIAVTLAAIVTAAAPSGPQWLIAAMILVWAGRLGSFLFRRIHAAGGDQRFDHIKISSSRFFVAWTLQGAWVVMTSCAAVSAILSEQPTAVGTVFAIGAAMWVVGFVIEVVADRQKSRFRADPANEGRFINTGLWARSRHPNYFGEILLWAGIAVMAIPYLSGTQWVVMLSPLFVYALLTRVSGIPTLARRGQQLWGDDPAYQAYLSSTPLLVPRLL
jgi:steroid 5-alpha reductase family enzyme